MEKELLVKLLIGGILLVVLLGAIGIMIFDLSPFRGENSLCRLTFGLIRGCQ